LQWQYVIRVAKELAESTPKVKIRPREHVRDDAGHSSSAITDKYIDIELRERHRSAKKKIIFE
jgi:hypothetical protein